MRSAGTSKALVWPTLAMLFAAVVLSLGAGAASACSNDNCSFSTTSFVVFEPNNTTSAIPVCTDTSTNGPFAGAPPLSSKALAQCTAICATGSFLAEGGTAPCCLSQWEPQTVVCTPPCTP